MRKPIDASSGSNLLGPWCANVFNISRYPFIIAANEKTLMCILFPLKEFGRFAQLFNASLERQLKELSVSKHSIAAELNQTTEITLSANTNRRTLGSMNDLVFQVKTMVYTMPSFTVAQLEQRIQEIPCGSIGYSTPGEAVKRVFKETAPA